MVRLSTMSEVHERPKVTDSRHHTVREARHEDIPLLADVERSAAELFTCFNVPVGDSVLDPSLLTTMLKDHHLWVAVNSEDKPVGFIGGFKIDGNFHVAEVSVGRDSQKQGIGNTLMNRMMADIGKEGFPAITLTTNMVLPFNRPWYQTLGYIELKAKDIGKELALLIEEESLHLDHTTRCAMRKDIF
ncbi:c09d469f-ee8f-4cd3-914a-d1a1bc8068f9-CDS [Sclerotinia trifoliorum]|uniref:C09d469f-ee8f-4cd3-914a-d1a1bc8068f9-CDS n=1 Tax=Sclerotinia trifoliorum TaxID=28548 RepID=A0A8H2VY62_9HELO|nr:c09d469f-ee8f-4cd3-914a-d1a1bc8068f9-CDS [Sclerotinia trifoliorum]